MANKKCPECQYVAEDETLSVCPKCEAELVEIEEDTETAAAIESTETEDAVQTEETADNTDVSEEVSADEEPAKSKTGYIVAIVALVVLILAGAAYIGISYFSGSKLPVTINVEKFSKDDISGMYTSESTGRYFEFTVKDTDVQVPDEEAAAEAAEKEAQEPVADSSASSDAEATSDAEPEPVPTKTEKHHGTFVSAYTESYIKNQCANEYIKRNELTEDFESYVKNKKLADDDYIKYIQDKKLEEDLQKFDDEMGFTTYMTQNSTTGTWKFENGLITLFGAEGSKMYDMAITKNGLVNSQTYFKGEPERGEKINARFECVAKDIPLSEDTVADITQSLILYDDGNFILKEAYTGDEAFENYAAGTYVIKDNILTIDLQGQKNKFSIIDDGICLGVYNK